jgi:hypothetical protein
MSQIVLNYPPPTVSPPAKGKVKVYSKVGSIYKMGSDGVEILLANQVDQIRSWPRYVKFGQLWQSYFNSWENQGTAWVQTVGGGFLLYAPAEAHNHLRSRVLNQLWARTDYYVDIQIFPTVWAAGNRVGMTLIPTNSNAKRVFFGYKQEDFGQAYLISKYSDYDTWNSDYAKVDTVAGAPIGPIYLRFAQTSTTWYFYMSKDGANFCEIYNVAKNDYWAGETIYRFAMTVVSNNAGAGSGGWFRSMTVTNGAI